MKPEVISVGDFCAYCFGPLLAPHVIVDSYGVKYCSDRCQKIAAKPVKGLPSYGIVDVGGRGGSIALEYTRNHQRAD